MAPKTSKQPNKIGDKSANRKPDGKFGPNNNANPTGRPRGSKGMTALLKHAIDEMNEGSGTAYDELIIKRTLLKAASGDMRAIELVFNYLDGKPGQRIVHEMRGVIGHGEVDNSKINEMLEKMEHEIEQEIAKGYATDTPS